MLLNRRIFYFQGMFPIRIMGIHVVNEPFVFKILMAMFWPFVSEKIRSRVIFTTLLIFIYGFLIHNRQLP